MNILQKILYPFITLFKNIKLSVRSLCSFSNGKLYEVKIIEEIPDIPSGLRELSNLLLKTRHESKKNLISVFEKMENNLSKRSCTLISTQVAGDRGVFVDTVLPCIPIVPDHRIENGPRKVEVITWIRNGFEDS